VRTELFDYDLPSDLIASRPPERRDGGRLCIVEEAGVRHSQVSHLASEILPGDLVVLNATKVRKARLICHRPTEAGGMGGARVELLFLELVGEGLWSALGKANRPLRPGDTLLAQDVRFEIRDRRDDGTLVVHTDADLERELDRLGTMPVPPYMERQGDEQDVERYQTVFAENLGSAAAPTAGLHLTAEILSEMERRGAQLARITLHVGIGTFRPVTVNDLDEHRMHSEVIEVNDEVVDQVRETRKRGGRVVAIGTTVVRALESARDASARGCVVPTRRSTNLLIQPGYEFQVVDSILTNFHQPRSTLLALVAAFAGLERIRDAYQVAVANHYRFLSYGDAMWIPQAFGRRAQ
jgi:S-adenosylmethionine:tRNA ribosyltransferase-isomerase